MRELEGLGPRRKGVGLAPAPDELAEEIPVVETKRYVKAVLGRARVYARLYAPEAVADTMPDAMADSSMVFTEPAELSERSTTVVAPSPGARAFLSRTPIRDALEAALYVAPAPP